MRWETQSLLLYVVNSLCIVIDPRVVVQTSLYCLLRSVAEAK